MACSTSTSVPGSRLRGGLVEHEHGRVGQRGPGQRHELLLPRREPRAPLAHLGVEALGQRGEALEHADRVEGVVDLVVGGARPGEADVVADRAVEQEALLRHDHDALAQRPQRGVAQVDAGERAPSPRSGRRAGR